MFVSANVDLAAYRAEISSPTPERDLSTFIDQVQRVSLQVGGSFLTIYYSISNNFLH